MAHDVRPEMREHRTRAIFECSLEVLAGGDSLAATAQPLVCAAALALEASWTWLLLFDSKDAPHLAFRYPPLSPPVSPRKLAQEFGPGHPFVKAAQSRLETIARLDGSQLDEGTSDVLLLPLILPGYRGLLAAGFPSAEAFPGDTEAMQRLLRKLEAALAVSIYREGQARSSCRRELVAAILTAVGGTLGIDETAERALDAIKRTTRWPSARLWMREEGGSQISLIGDQDDRHPITDPGRLVREAFETGRTAFSRPLEEGAAEWQGVELAVPLGGRGAWVLWCATTGAAPFGLADARLAEEAARALYAPLCRSLAYDAAESQRLRFEALNEQAADILVATDTKGTIEYVNQAFSSHTGWARHEALGRNVGFLRSGVHTSDVYRSLWETILSGQVFRGVLVNRKRSGDLYYEEKTITPIRDARGRITHFVSVGRDITQRIVTDARQTELQSRLQEAVAEWSATFDAVPFPILLLDPAGVVLRANRATRELLGLPWKEIVGRPLPALSEEPWPAIKKAFRRLGARSGSFALAEVRGPSAAHWDVTANVLQGDVLKDHIIILARDITPLVKLQQSLRSSQTMAALGSLVAGVAHEVRNPLFAISATIEAFENEFANVDGFAEYRRVLAEETRRLTGFMQELLEFGRPLSTSLSPGSVTEVILRAMRSCEIIARTSGVTLHSHIADGLPEILMERRRLEEVFHNLIENAIQHSPSGGTVTVAASVTVSEDLPVIRVSIEDEGPGVDAADEQHLFEPFFTRRRGGTGLGLAIVKRIAEEHCADVQLSNGRDGGALALVQLPVPLTLDSVHPDR